MSDNPKVVGLIRLSTQEQAEQGRAGIDRQRRDIEAAARAHGLDVIRVVEVIESGTKMRGQRDFDQIKRELESGSIDGIACSHLDRVTRPNSFDDFGIWQVFRANRKRIWTPGQAVEPWTQHGFMHVTMYSMFAGVERQMIVARTTAGKEVFRERGWHPNGDHLLARAVGCERTKDGRRTVDCRWFYKEPDASRVRRAFELLLQGHSYGAIAATIGGGWTRQGIRGAMLNTIWYGVRTYPPTADRAEPLERRVIPESEALVSRATWDAAQRILAGRKKAWGAAKRMPRFLLTGLLKCDCGKPYYTKSSSPKDRTKTLEHYHCSSLLPKRGPRCGAGYLQRAAVDQVVVDQVKRWFRDPERLYRMLELSKRDMEPKTDAAKLERELAKLEAKRQRLVDIYSDGDISKPEFHNRLAAVEQAKRDIEAMMPTKAPALDARRAATAVAEFFAGFEDQTFEDRQRALKAAFKEFRVENGAITGWTMDGGFIGGIAKVSTRCSAQLQISDHPDLVIVLPEPIAIPKIDKRRKAS